MCRVDLRGTGTSEGIAAGEYLPQEQDDLCGVIDWLSPTSSSRPRRTTSSSESATGGA